MTVPTQVLAAYGLRNLTPIHIGNINETYRAHDDGGEVILQRLNPIFDATVHHDIQAVTEHLSRAGMATPKLRATNAGELWHEDHEGGVWRVLNAIAGLNLDRADSSARVAAAGELLGRFHRGVADLQHTFVTESRIAHDTPRHLGILRQALAEHRDHAAYERVEPVAEAILTLADDIELTQPETRRICHGDPKLNNIIFAPSGEAICLIDLDTLGPMPVALELGDAFRSWCNPTGEDAESSHFNLEYFRAGIAAYSTIVDGWLSEAELIAVVPATFRIIVELAARFCADALRESYFRWDAQRFEHPWQHHLLRARGQLALAQSFDREGAAAIVAQLTSG